MNAIGKISASDRYERCVQMSKRARWDIDEDVMSHAGDWVTRLIRRRGEPAF
jgi:hypothetical protein